MRHKGFQYSMIERKRRGISLRVVSLIGPHQAHHYNNTRSLADRISFLPSSRCALLKDDPPFPSFPPSSCRGRWHDSVGRTINLTCGQLPTGTKNFHFCDASLHLCHNQTLQYRSIDLQKHQNVSFINQGREPIDHRSVWIIQSTPLHFVSIGPPPHEPVTAGACFLNVIRTK